ncbi:MAG: hypothetical protein LBJ82_06810, partial [Deltaproteobacteria bacterium]|nr:hypothetical protein [Deltaproteobacteria bacterium]
MSVPFPLGVFKPAAKAVERMLESAGMGMWRIVRSGKDASFTVDRRGRKLLDLEGEALPMPLADFCGRFLQSESGLPEAVQSAGPGETFDLSLDLLREAPGKTARIIFFGAAEATEGESLILSGGLRAADPPEAPRPSEKPPCQALRESAENWLGVPAYKIGLFTWDWRPQSGAFF